MSAASAAHLTKHFAHLTDPRVDRTKEHLLLDMVVMAICAILAGADSGVAVEAFGRAKEKWLRTFLELPNGIPSHDILRLRSGQALWARLCRSRSP